VIEHLIKNAQFLSILLTKREWNEFFDAHFNDQKRWHFQLRVQFLNIVLNFGAQIDGED
jgi:hypothetical protein